MHDFIEIKLENNKKIYFASDQHFGSPDYVSSLKREKIFVNFLTEIEPDCQALFIVGDFFDFWFEYNQVVPKGFIRSLGKLTEMSDRGISIYFFAGNHDIWIKDYLSKEMGFEIFVKEQNFLINGEKFLLAHGDGLGPGDNGYKRMKKLFTNKIANWLFRWLHPDIGIWLGNYMSRNNKTISGEEDSKFLGEEKEWLIIYSKEKLKEQDYKYFIYGHRHLPMKLGIGNDVYYINLGDWIKYFTYASYDGKDLNLLEYK